MISFLRKRLKISISYYCIVVRFMHFGRGTKDNLAQIFAFAFFVLLCLFHANLLEISKDLIIKQSYKLEMTVCL